MYTQYIYKESRPSALLLSLLLGCLLLSCSPDMPEVFDTDNIDSARIDSIALKPSNSLLIASADNAVDLTPVCYIKYGEEYRLIAPANVRNEWFQIQDETGATVPRLYSAPSSDIGKVKTFTLSLKGTSLKSHGATVEIVPLQESDALQEIVVPIVFHFIQGKKEIKEYGTHYDIKLFERQLDKLNHAFGGTIHKDATGVDTKIRFKPALYKPNGERLLEPGLNRIEVDQQTISEIISKLDAVVSDKGLLWPVDKYLNVWVYSDLDNSGYKFGEFFQQFKPMMINMPPMPDEYIPGVEAAPNPIGDFPDGMPAMAKGMLYRIQDFENENKGFGNFSANAPDFPFYIGLFFGLKPTYEEDYCRDTPYYPKEKDGMYKTNKTMYKESDVNFFTSRNIMDDVIGLHVTVTKEQNLRMRWFLEHATGRQPWKSDFAFTGK